MWLFSPISFQLIKILASGLDAELPFHKVRMVSPFLRGIQEVPPVSRIVVKPGVKGAIQRLPAAWTLSPISLIWSKEAGFRYGSWLDQ